MLTTIDVVVSKSGQEQLLAIQSKLVRDLEGTPSMCYPSNVNEVAMDTLQNNKVKYTWSTEHLTDNVVHG